MQLRAMGIHLTVSVLGLFHAFGQPIILTQPQDQTNILGETATFSVEANGTGVLSYQWSAYINILTFTNIPGAINATLVVPDVEPTSHQFRVAVTDEGGTVLSRLARLTVLTPPIIVSEPGDQIVEPGNNVTFQVSTTGSPPFSYQWQRDGTNLVGETSSHLDLGDVQINQAGSYRVIISNLAGTVTSRDARLTVAILPPRITGQLQDQISTIGGSALFSVVASSSIEISYQWQFQGTDLPGQTNRTLSLSDLRLEERGRYTVVISNDSGSVTSRVATLSIPVTLHASLHPPLNIRQESKEVIVNWSQEGMLEEADNPMGPWTTLSNTTGTISLTPSTPATFYRVRDPNPRPSRLFLPSTFDGQTPLPLVIALHGYPLDGDWVENFFKFLPRAELEEFLYCLPEGSQELDGDPFWNATDACCNFSLIDPDDAGFLRRLILTIMESYHADPRRIYLIGHSNGGFMAYRMACESADLIAGIVSVAGGTYKVPSDCHPSESVNVLHIHGTTDANVPYGGGSINAPYPGAEESTALWAGYNGATDLMTDPVPLDLVENAPGAETVISRYNQSPPGGSVELWTMEGVDHWPVFTPAFTEVVMNWLLARPKPE